MNITIRKALLTDLQEIQTLFVDTIKSACNKDYTAEQIGVWISSVEDKDRWMEFIQNQYFILAEMESKIVGIGSLDKGSYIDLLYVHKDFLKKGIASLLYENLKEEANKLGFDTLTSDVSITAQPFFERKGFIVIKENSNIRNGVEILNYRMELNK